MKLLLFIFISFCLFSCRSLYTQHSHNIKEEIKTHKKIAIFPVLYNCDCYNKKHIKSRKKLDKSIKHQQLLYDMLQQDTIILTVALQPIQQTNAILDSLQIDFRTIYCNSFTLKGKRITSYMLPELLGVDAVILTEINSRSLGLLGIPLMILPYFFGATEGGRELIYSVTLAQEIITIKEQKIWTIGIRNSLTIIPPIASKKYIRVAVREFPYRQKK